MGGCLSELVPGSTEGAVFTATWIIVTILTTVMQDQCLVAAIVHSLTFRGMRLGMVRAMLARQTTRQPANTAQAIAAAVAAVVVAAVAVIHVNA